MRTKIFILTQKHQFHERICLILERKLGNESNLDLLKEEALIYGEKIKERHEVVQIIFINLDSQKSLLPQEETK